MCDFVFRPSLWPKSTGELDEPWHCPYSEVSGESYCIFHLVQSKREFYFSSQEERQSEYESIVEEEGQLTVICTAIDGLNLDRLSQHLGDKATIQIAFSTVGELHAPDTEIEQEISIFDCSIEFLNATHLDFKRQVRSHRSRFDRIELIKSTFHRKAVFSACEFGVWMADGTTFFDEVCFAEYPGEDIGIDEIDELHGNNPSTFKNTALFEGVDFESSSDFSGVTFEEGASFFLSTFHSPIRFVDVKCDIGLQMEACEFQSGGRIANSEIDIFSLNSSTISADLYITNCKVSQPYPKKLRRTIDNHSTAEGGTNLTHYGQSQYPEVFSEFIGKVNTYSITMLGVESDSEVAIKNCQLENGISLSRSTLESLKIDVSVRDKHTPLAFVNAEVMGGVFHFDTSSPIYNLENGTLGDVDLRYSGIKNPFRKLYISNTDFKGFDFTKYRKELSRAEWEIDVVDSKFGTISAERTEATYSKARVAASKQGDNLAASEFFVKELRARRRRHFRQADRADEPEVQFRSYLDVISNGIFDISCRYAESSSRTISASLSIIFIFTFAYALLSADVGDKAVLSQDIPFSNEITLNLDYLIFSFQSFTSFVVGTNSTTLSAPVRILSAIEGFIGAFMIGLFVVTVVRSVNR